MILFSQRHEIERQFYKWCEENGAANCPMNVVAFMQGKGWLNEEKIRNDVPIKMARGVQK